MMKRLFTFLAVLALSTLMAVNVFASGELVVDNADILTDAEESSLNAKLTALQSAYGMDFIALTTSSTDGKTWRDYADDYYDNNGYSKDGILMLVNMEEGNRGYIFSTAGKGIEYFTDYGLNEMEDNVYDYLASGNYAGAFDQYVSDADRLCAMAVNGEVYDVPGYDNNNANEKRGIGIPTAVIAALIIGALIALIVVSVMKSKHKSVRAKQEATNYMIPGSLNITNSKDTFLYVNVTHVPIPQNNNRGPGGGGSSVHISSGGISHGGSGGRGF